MREPAFRFSVLISLLVLAGCMMSSTQTKPHPERIAFTANLTAQQETPPTDSTGSGSATILLDRTSKTLSWDIIYSGLTGPAVAAHFHGPAARGAKAGVQIALNLTAAPGKIHGSAVLTDQQIEQIRAGQWYVNIHTKKYPDGEIRGQVEPAHI